MIADLPLMKSLLTRLTKNVMLPLRLSAETSATDSVVQIKIYGSDTIVLVTSNKKN